MIFKGADAISSCRSDSNLALKMWYVSISNFTWYFLLWLLRGFLIVSFWLELFGNHGSRAILVRAYAIAAFLLSVSNTQIRLALFINDHAYFISKCQKPSVHPNCLADLDFCRGVLWWHLDLASFCNETLRGVQAEMGGQRPLVGQGDGPWNSLAHHVQAEVNELAVNPQLVWRSNSKNKN